MPPESGNAFSVAVFGFGFRTMQNQIEKQNMKWQLNFPSGV